MRFSVFLPLLLLPVASLAASHPKHFDQCYNILRYEQAFCKIYLHGQLPPRSTSTITSTTVSTPHAVSATTTTLTTATGTTSTTVPVSVTSTETDTETLTATVDVTTTQTSETTLTVQSGITTIQEMGTQQRRRRSQALQKQVAPFSNQVITEVCFSVLYGATTRPAATARTTTVAFAATPTSSFTATSVATVYLTSTFSSTSTLIATTTADVTVQVTDVSTELATSTATLVEPTATKYLGNGAAGCPSDCFADLDVNGQQYCDNLRGPCPSAGCSSDDNCGDTGFCAGQALQGCGKNICIPFSSLCRTSSSGRRGMMEMMGRMKHSAARDQQDVAGLRMIRPASKTA